MSAPIFPFDADAAQPDGDEGGDDEQDEGEQAQPHGFAHDDTPGHTGPPRKTPGRAVRSRRCDGPKPLRPERKIRLRPALAM